MTIVLFHNYYDDNHLEKVKEEMKQLGRPKIRAIWSETQGVWLAVEGCHRLRAAKELGITPIIIDISKQKTAIIQCDDEDTEVDIEQLKEELEEEAWKKEVIDFEEEE